MIGIGKKKDERTEEARVSSPPIDVYENDGEFLLVADLPGVAQDGAEVTIHEQRMVLRASATTKSYEREFIVPTSVDGERISAAMTAGVLTVHLPKRAAYQPRQIPVRGA